MPLPQPYCVRDRADLTRLAETGAGGCFALRPSLGFASLRARLAFGSPRLRLRSLSRRMSVPGSTHQRVGERGGIGVTSEGVPAAGRGDRTLVGCPGLRGSSGKDTPPALDSRSW